LHEVLNKPDLVVLGMHRSGTSMVSSLLESLGFFAGEPGDLLPAQEDNPRGFGERRDVVALNDAILDSWDASWFHPPAGDPEPHPDWQAETRGIVQRLGPGPWVLKDPRMLATWSCWDDALGDIIAVYVYRSAAAVANSLERRNGFPPDLGLALWEYYNRRALQILQGRPFVAISYEDFRRAPRATAQLLLTDLQGHGLSVEFTREVADGLFDATLDHSADIAGGIQLLYTPAQLRLDECCKAVVETGKLPDTLPAPDPAQQFRLSSLAGAFGYSSNVQQLEKEVRACRGERDECLLQLDAMERRHAEEVRWIESERVAEELRHAEQVRRIQSEQAAEELRHAEQVRRIQSEQAAEELRHESELLAERQKFYGTLMAFDRSLIGWLVDKVIWAYRILTLRPGRSTAYQDLVITAREFMQDSPVEFSDSVLPTRSRSRILLDVIGYMVRNPAGSLRSLSWPRFKRALSIFSGSDRQDLELWVQQRFPGQVTSGLSHDHPAERVELDELCLEIPCSEQPRVSIIIPAFNQYRMTAYCLQSLLRSAPLVSYEVILADDGSSDLTADIETRISGLRIFRPDENQGFVRNCNAAARLARGEYLLFLNNDTAFCESWLDKLADVLDRDPNAGVVGPQLLFADGRLQEAGGIIWDDASGWNFGRMDDSSKPEYSYLKPCDYVSGACMLVRSALWEQLGGFDERFVPAYYEDTDLCFAARAAGYSVIYQPHSRVIHFEGVTNGTDLGSGVKKYQAQNQVKFRDKWSRVLVRDHYPNGSEVFRARDRSRGKRTVLVIDHYVPSFDKDAGSRSTWMYLQLLVSMGYKVMFMGANFFPHQPYTAALQELGIEVLVGESIARGLGSWFQDHAEDIDTVYIHRPHVAEQFLDLLRSRLPGTRLIYFGHDLHYLRLQREEAVTGNAATLQAANEWYRREFNVFDQVDKIYYPSQAEVDVILAKRPELPVRAIPLYVLNDSEPRGYEPPGRSGILFVGGFGHPPNEDAICWFVQEVMPAVWQNFSQMKVHVVGSNATVAVQGLASPRVMVHGYLTDEALAQLYGEVQQVVVPLRFGAGVKGKIIEAVQNGVPVTTTSIGSEGLPMAEEVLNIADDIAGLAEWVMAVAREDPLVMSKLGRYGAWLHDNFSRSRAMGIIREDFGEPRQEDSCAL
jgi:GT2 family glycosyltransferase